MFPVKSAPSNVSLKVPRTASTLRSWTSWSSSPGSPFALVVTVRIPCVPPSRRVSRIVWPGITSSRSIVSENEPSTPTGTACTVPMDGLKLVSPGR